MLPDPKYSLAKATIQLFTPFRPMLANRDGLKSIERVMEGRPFYIEVKYDGERLLIHRDKAGNYQFFSRDGIPVRRQSVTIRWPFERVGRPGYV